jgi:hypothetical protein
MYIAVECFLDVTLMQVLGFSAAQINHAGNKGKVLKTIKQDNKYKYGMVDKDEDTIGKLGNLRQFSALDTQDGLTLCAYVADSSRRLIVVDEKLEIWLLYACRHVGLKPETFGLPSSYALLHEASIAKDRPKISQLVNALQQNQSTHIATLRHFLRQLEDR